MAFLIGGANSAADDAYSVANSCRFDLAGTSYMARSPSGATNRKTFTISFWVKRCGEDVEDYFFNVGPGATDRFNILFLYEGMYVWENVDGWDISFDTSMMFRDPSAWYHVVIAIDTTQATEANRFKVYVNGSQITAWAEAGYPDQNYDTKVNTTDEMRWGRNFGSETQYFSGYLAEVILIDGTAYAASDFGEFDSDSPTIWKPKDPSGLTFGTNGYWLDFEDSSALGNDVSGNNNDFSVTNLAATDQSSDSPTNNFATGNPLQTNDLPTFSEGNLAYTNGSNVYKSGVSTIGVSSGKWFMECNWVSGTTALNGVIDEQDLNAQLLTAPAAGVGFTTNSVGYFKDGTKFIADSNTSYGASLAAGDIIGIALDLDSGTKTVTFYKNGSSQGAINLPTGGTGTFFFASSVYAAVTHANYGNPPYANTSSVADANGYGAFEYAPPSGYFALCTKNLAQYG